MDDGTYRETEEEGEGENAYESVGMRKRPLTTTTSKDELLRRQMRDAFRLPKGGGRD